MYVYRPIYFFYLFRGNYTSIAIAYNAHASLL